jgi:hypothetical protein
LTDYSLGPLVETDEHYALLRHTLTLSPQGVALEFGVGSGQSTRILAEHMPVIGFDSWLGLPESWRPEFPAGSFAHMPPEIENVDLIDGWFEDTLPGFSFPVAGLVHIDCDLYSSTKTVLDHTPLTRGCIVVFDEWHGYDGCEDHEQRAWREYAAANDINWSVIGHGHEAWAIRIGTA